MGIIPEIFHLVIHGFKQLRGQIYLQLHVYVHIQIYIQPYVSKFHK